MGLCPSHPNTGPSFHEGVCSQDRRICGSSNTNGGRWQCDHQAIGPGYWTGREEDPPTRKATALTRMCMKLRRTASPAKLRTRPLPAKPSSLLGRGMNSMEVRIRLGSGPGAGGGPIHHRPGPPVNVPGSASTLRRWLLQGGATPKRGVLERVSALWPQSYSNNKNPSECSQPQPA